jgi:molybdate transport system substrate-binding protein
MSNPDVEVLGLLPGNLRQVTILCASVTASAKEPEAAKAFIAFIASPAAKAVYKPKGLAID